MSEINRSEAFGRYKVKPSNRARSAVTADRALVLTCSYAGFRRAEADVLRYEENLTDATDPSTTLLRAHLAEALAHELDVRLIVAIALRRTPSPEVPAGTERTARTSFHARKDLSGRVTFFDGHRFVVEFRRDAAVVSRDSNTREYAPHI
jgi:hypothetical protein